MIPAYVSALSVVIFLGQMVNIAFQPPQQLQVSAENTNAGLLKRCRLHVQELGLQLFLFRLARLATCTALVVLSLISPTSNASARVWLLLAYVRFHVPFYRLVRLISIQLYSCILAFLSVATKLPHSRIATHHLNVVILAPFVVYGYRDAWTLVTYHHSPVDGKMIWAKIGCMSFAAVLLPLFAPRQYIPSTLR